METEGAAEGGWGSDLRNRKQASQFDITVEERKQEVRVPGTLEEKRKRVAQPQSRKLSKVKHNNKTEEGRKRKCSKIAEVLMVGLRYRRVMRSGCVCRRFLKIHYGT